MAPVASILIDGAAETYSLETSESRSLGKTIRAINSGPAAINAVVKTGLTNSEAFSRENFISLETTGMKTIPTVLTSVIVEAVTR